MLGFRVSRAAQQDVRGIGQYTQRKWGAAQRRLYLSRLESKFSQLAESPKLSPERTEFDPPVRIHNYEKHLIVYVADDAGVLIVRVLHESMDLPSRLSLNRS